MTGGRVSRIDRLPETTREWLNAQIRDGRERAAILDELHKHFPEIEPPISPSSLQRYALRFTTRMERGKSRLKLASDAGLLAAATDGSADAIAISDALLTMLFQCLEEPDIDLIADAALALQRITRSAHTARQIAHLKQRISAGEREIERALARNRGINTDTATAIPRRLDGKERCRMIDRDRLHSAAEARACRTGESYRVAPRRRRPRSGRRPEPRKPGPAARRLAHARPQRRQ